MERIFEGEEREWAYEEDNEVDNVLVREMKNANGPTTRTMLWIMFW
jgi:hypothetical protein